MRLSVDVLFYNKLNLLNCLTVIFQLHLKDCILCKLTHPDAWCNFMHFRGSFFGLFSSFSKFCRYSITCLWFFNSFL